MHFPIGRTHLRQLRSTSQIKSLCLAIDLAAPMTSRGAEALGQNMERKHRSTQMTTHKPNTTFFSVKQVADLLNISTSTVRGERIYGQLPHYRFASTIRISSDDLRKYMNKVRR
jgi:excisionase family DNA binding protein